MLKTFFFLLRFALLVSDIYFLFPIYFFLSFCGRRRKIKSYNHQAIFNQMLYKSNETVSNEKFYSRNKKQKIRYEVDKKAV